MTRNEHGFGLLVALTMTVATAAQTEPPLERATAAILKAFQSHDIVMLGENHGNKQEYEWLRSLVDTPEFADRVDDIVMEFGNSLYQAPVDRYVRGEEIPLEQIQGAWRDSVASVGPPSPVYASLYQSGSGDQQKTQRSTSNPRCLRRPGYRMEPGQTGKRHSCRT